MIFFRGPYGKLMMAVSEEGQDTLREGTHNLRGIYPCANDSQSYILVPFNPLSL